MCYGRKRNVFPRSLFEYHGPLFLIRYLNILCVPCQELVRLTCGTRPGNSVLTVTYSVVDRSQLGSNGQQRIHTGYLQDAEPTRTGQGHRELIICPIDSNGESLVFDSLFCISEYM